MADRRGEVLRYESQGELHRDFHASSVDGVSYLLDNYGEEALAEVLENVGTKVYAQLHAKLAAGDKSELVAWWRYYMDREGGDYAIEETADGAVLTVNTCPALKHLEKIGVAENGRMCLATRLLNAGFCKDTPFEITVEKTGAYSCRQVLRRK